MKLTLRRIAFKDAYTIGHLYINGTFFSDTLEDKNRDLNHDGKFDNGEVKVYGQTCIPFGTYKIIIDYSPHFKRETAHLLNVPSFDMIRMHAGNKPEDTLGCILVGSNKIKGQLVNSRVAENKLTEIIKGALAKKEEVTIEII